MDKTRNVIFLDIDGVLQPKNNQFRFKYDLDELSRRLAAQFGDNQYLEMDKYDLGAIYYDWDKSAVENLRKLCTIQQGEIVISSDWRYYSPLSRLINYFRIHDLHAYITGEIPKTSGKYRCGQITEYLDANPDILHFCILDDAWISEFTATYPEHFVQCSIKFDEAAYLKAAAILSR